MALPEPDFTELRPVWRRRMARIRRVHERYDPRGAARPRRDPAEREWLERRGRTGPFREVEVDEKLRRAFWERNR